MSFLFVPDASRRSSPRTWILIGSILLLSALVVYRYSLLNASLLSTGDWPALTHQQMIEYTPFPSILDLSQSLGAYNLAYGPIFPLYALEGWLAHLGLGFEATERLIWYWPAVLVGLFSSYLLGYRMLGRRHGWPLLGAWVFVFNPYNLTLQDRGDIAMSAADALIPAILLLLTRYVEAETFHPWRWFWLTLLITLQIAYEPRVTYITAAICLIYALWLVGTAWHCDGTPTPQLLSLLRRGAIMIGVLVPMQAWWILPAVTVRSPQIPVGSIGVDWVAALSFARINDTLALNHPFWPADWLFVTFPTQAVFLLIPCSFVLLLAQRRQSPRVLFLFTLLLCGMFLAKGDNPPIGSLYVWMYNHVPGFVLFRDPLKFYHLMTIAYAMLFMLAISRTAAWIGTRLHNLWQHRAVLLGWVTLCTLLALLPATATQGVWWGQAFTGILSPTPAAHQPLPSDYASLNAYLTRSSYGRVLWLPGRSNDALSTNDHPAIDVTVLGQQYLPHASLTPALGWLFRPDMPLILRVLSIRYVVIAEDNPGFVFSYQAGTPYGTPAWYIAQCKHWLPGWGTMGFGHIVLFVAPQPSSRLYLGRLRSPLTTASLDTMLLSGHQITTQQVILPDPLASLTMQQESATHLAATTPFLTHRAILILDDDYTPFWLINVRTLTTSTSHAAPSITVRSSHRRINGYANAWVLPAGAAYQITLDYYPQTVMLRGGQISLLAILAAGLVSLRLARMRRRPARAVPHVPATPRAAQV